MMIPHHRTAASGFSLIEALIALAIAGVAFVVLTNTFANTLTALRMMSIEADLQADVRFVRSIAIQVTDLDEFERGDSIETLDRGRADWSGEVEETAIPDLFRVRLRVAFPTSPDRSGPTEHEEVIYLLRPTWSNPVDRSSLLADFKDQVEVRRMQYDW